MNAGPRAGVSAAHVAELARELAPLVVGSRVKDVQALPPRDLLFVLEPEAERVPGRAIVRLRLSADPNAPRLHLQHGRVHRHEGAVGPFFARAAEELVGARLVALTPVAGDRAAILEFRETPSGQRRALGVELFGRRANLLLLDRADRVTDVLVPPPQRADAARLAIGAEWSLPGSGRGASGDTTPIVEAFPARDAEAPELAPLSWHVERALGDQAVDARNDEARKRLVARVERKHKKARGLVQGLEKRAAAADGAERVREEGELLKGHLHALKRGLETVEVPDFFGDGAPRRIALDPKLTPRENVERLFARYKKLERSRTTVERELERGRAKLAELEALLERARASDDPTALDAEAVAAGLLDPLQEADQRKRKAPAPRLPYRAFHTQRGTEIRVGRSARDNDLLTFRHARGNDVWLHTADAPGSHVVLRTEKNAEPDDEDVLDAAHLAVHFSPLSGARRATVHVARRKDVHKPRGAKAGLVTLSGGRNLALRLQPERFERLLRNRPEPGGGPDGGAT